MLLSHGVQELPCHEPWRILIFRMNFAGGFAKFSWSGHIFTFKSLIFSSLLRTVLVKRSIRLDTRLATSSHDTCVWHLSKLRVCFDKFHKCTYKNSLDFSTSCSSNAKISFGLLSGVREALGCFRVSAGRVRNVTSTNMLELFLNNSPHQNPNERNI